MAIAVIQANFGDDLEHGVAMQMMRSGWTWDIWKKLIKCSERITLRCEGEKKIESRQFQVFDLSICTVVSI